MYLTLISLSLVKATWESLGCFRLNEEDKTIRPPSTSRDTACTDWRKFDRKCRSGLPFYRFPITEPQDCQLQCLAKGLDVAGIVTDVECRCGASVKLDHVWRVLGKTQDAFEVVDYLLPPHVQSESCEVKAWMYSGDRVADSGMPTPSLLSEIPLIDEEYIQSIVAGTRATVALEGSRPEDFDKLFKSIDDRRSLWWQRAGSSLVETTASDWTGEIAKIAEAVNGIISTQRESTPWTVEQNNQLGRIVNSTMSIFNQCYSTN